MIIRIFQMIKKGVTRHEKISQILGRRRAGDLSDQAIHNGLKRIPLASDTGRQAGFSAIQT